MRRASSRLGRGVTLIEAMATMVVLSFGMLGATYVVLQGSRQNRANYAQQQAYVIAERELDAILSMGCTVNITTNRCDNLMALATDTTRTQKNVFWNADGVYATSTGTDAGTTAVQRPYHVVIDIDPPYEGTERGNPAPERVLVNGQRGVMHNVRVTVSWDDDGRTETPFRVVALQTRVAR